MIFRCFSLPPPSLSSLLSLPLSLSPLPASPHLPCNPPSVSLSIYLFVQSNLSLFCFISLSICPSVCPSVRPFVCLSVSPSPSPPPPSHPSFTRSLTLSLSRPLSHCHPPGSHSRHSLKIAIQFKAVPRGVIDYQVSGLISRALCAGGVSHAFHKVGPSLCQFLGSAYFGTDRPALAEKSLGSRCDSILRSIVTTCYDTAMPS